MGSLFFIVGSLTYSSIASFFMFFTLIGHILGVNILRKIYKGVSTLKDRFDIFWILIFMSFGALSYLIFYFL